MSLRASFIIIGGLAGSVGCASPAWSPGPWAPSVAGSSAFEAGVSGSGTSSSGLAFGGEVQAYPAGVIPAVHVQKPVSEQGVITGRLGWNFTDRQDFGEHDEERGGGPGGGVGYRHYFGPGRAGWLLGARVDLWFLEIDWEDDARGGRPAREGDTDVIVLQPTVEGGYRFRLGERWTCDLALGLGYEINVDEDGEDVGEGGIALLGATFLFGPGH